MLEDLITISIVGLITGFIFSVPVAGPISILITSKGLKGDLHNGLMAAIGASIIDLLYCFIAVFGFTKLISLYRPLFPFILGVGSIFLFIIGIKIYKTKFDVENISQSIVPKKVKTQKAFWMGFFVNLLNPTLFLGWMTSSIMIMTLVAQLGFNTGGLDIQLDKQKNTLEDISNNHDNNNQELKMITPTRIDFVTFHAEVLDRLDSNKLKKKLTNCYILGKNKINYTLKKGLNKKDIKQIATIFNFLRYEHVQENTYLHEEETFTISGYELLISISYAFFVAIGTIIWFYYYCLFLVRYRKKIKISVINRIIQLLGLLLCGFGVYLAFKAFAFF